MRKRNALLIVCLVTLLASTAQAQNASGANNAALNGNYAFTFSGFTGSGGFLTGRGKGESGIAILWLEIIAPFAWRFRKRPAIAFENDPR